MQEDFSSQKMDQLIQHQDFAKHDVIKLSLDKLRIALQELLTAIRLSNEDADIDYIYDSL